ncbi:MAG: DUF2079 domain-containing protein [Streptosporangiales bacterium]|nr:DUF2079 domain-containing protein [Streptosporangiales bacterium]
MYVSVGIACVTETAVGGAAIRLGRRPPHRLVVGGLTVLAAVGFAVVSLIRFHRFRSTSYDLVIFDQAIRSYAEFGLPYAPIKAADGLSPGTSVLGDHISPLNALLAPLYWVWDDPRMLLAAQGVLFGLAVPPLWRYVRRTLDTFAAYAVVGCYVFSFPVLYAALADFHEAAFAPVLAALVIERFDAYARGRTGPAGALAALAALLLVKEDMGLLVGGFGLWLTATRRWRLGLPLAVLGPTWTALTTQVLVPAFGGRADFYWRYGALGEDLPAAALSVLTDPVGALQIVITPADKVLLLGLLGLPVLFACLCSPLILTVLPLLAARLLSDHLTWWGVEHHYNAFIIVPILCAAADGVRRLRIGLGRLAGSRPPRPGLVTGRRAHRAWAVAALAVTVLVAWDRPLSDLAPRTPGEVRRAAAAERLVAMVPDGVTVEAPNELGPYLTRRATVLLWMDPPQDAAWVLADVGAPATPFGDVENQRDAVIGLLASDYREVAGEQGYVLLRRVAEPWPSGP